MDNYKNRHAQDRTVDLLDVTEALIPAELHACNLVPRPRLELGTYSLKVSYSTIELAELKNWWDLSDLNTQPSR